jgi:S1-C subfamily serine protease
LGQKVQILCDFHSEEKQPSTNWSKRYVLLTEYSKIHYNSYINMEDLTKQQIVLVTLLVSFVTSIATGIVTVSLVDQAPKGVTQTINQVVERTIERVVPQTASVGDATTSSRNFEEQLATTVDRSTKGLVRLKNIDAGPNEKSITGFGVVVSKDGVIVTDKSTIAAAGTYRAVFSDGRELPVTLVQSQNDGDIAFLIISAYGTSTTVYTTVPFAVGNLSLGETVFAIGGGKSLRLTKGFVSDADTSEQILTSLTDKEIEIGSPLINSAGEFIAIKTASIEGFYPLSLIRAAIPAEGTYSK